MGVVDRFNEANTGLEDLLHQGQGSLRIAAADQDPDFFENPGNLVAIVGSRKPKISAAANEFLDPSPYLLLVFRWGLPVGEGRDFPVDRRVSSVERQDQLDQFLPVEIAKLPSQNVVHDREDFALAR